MSDWIHSYASLRSHPKTRKLARRVGGLAQAIGHLHCLWWWCMEYARDGDVARFDTDVIADAASWDGDPDQFVGYLLECGFVDELDDRLVIHDFEDHIGKYLDRLERNAGRKRDMREAYADGTIATVRDRDQDHCRYCAKVVSWTDKRGPDGGTYDHVDPKGPSTASNLVVCCRACNSRKGDRPVSRSGLTLIQVGTKYDLSPDLVEREKEREKERTAAHVENPVDNSGSRRAKGKGTTPGVAKRARSKSEPTPLREYISARKGETQ